MRTTNCLQDRYFGLRPHYEVSTCRFLRSNFQHWTNKIAWFTKLEFRVNRLPIAMHSCNHMISHHLQQLKILCSPGAWCPLHSTRGYRIWWECRYGEKSYILVVCQSYVFLHQAKWIIIYLDFFRARFQFWYEGPCGKQGASTSLPLSTITSSFLYVNSKSSIMYFSVLFVRLRQNGFLQ